VPGAWVRASSASVNFVAGESKRLGRALLSAGVVLAASVVAAPLVRGAAERTRDSALPRRLQPGEQPLPMRAGEWPEWKPEASEERPGLRNQAFVFKNAANIDATNKYENIIPSNIHTENG
jgi:hypothetical protein